MTKINKEEKKMHSILLVLKVLMLSFLFKHSSVVCQIITYISRVCPCVCVRACVCVPNEDFSHLGLCLESSKIEQVAV